MPAGGVQYKCRQTNVKQHTGDETTYKFFFFFHYITPFGKGACRCNGGALSDLRSREVNPAACGAGESSSFVHDIGKKY